jgi:predicted secreted protein
MTCEAAVHSQAIRTAGPGRPVWHHRRNVRVVTHRVLEDPSSDDQVSLGSGDTLEIRLRQRGGTGYLWSVGKRSELLTLTDDRTELGSSAAGAAGIRVLVFETASEGAGELRLELGRAWESSPIEVLELPVTVSAT